MVSILWSDDLDDLGPIDVSSVATQCDPSVTQTSTPAEALKTQKNTKTAIHIKLLFRRSTRCYLKLSIAIYSYLLAIFYNQLSCWASLLLDLPVITGCGLADEGLNKIGSCDLRHGGQQQSKLLGGWAILAQKNVNLENRDKKPMTY